MIKTIIQTVKKNGEIAGLIFLVLIAVTFTSYFNYKKNISNEKYNSFINNIYFKKSLNYLIDNLEPKYKKIKH